MQGNKQQLAYLCCQSSNVHVFLLACIMAWRTVSLQEQTFVHKVMFVPACVFCLAVLLVCHSLLTLLVNLTGMCDRWLHWWMTTLNTQQEKFSYAAS